MTDPDRRPAASFVRSRAVQAALLLGFALLARAVGLLPSVINPDESVFALAAREVVAGHLPYVTLFDNKPVGSTLLIALVSKVFGQSILAVRLLGAACVWATALLVLAIGARGGLTRLQAFMAALAFIAFSSTMGGLATLTENLLAPFTAAAVLLLQHLLAPSQAASRPWLALTAGLACGAAVAIKLVPAVPGFAVAGLVLALLLARRTISFGSAALLGGLFAIGSAVPMLTAAAVYAGAGHWPEFLYSNFGFARAYADIHPRIAVVAQRLGTTIDAIWPLLGLAAVAAITLAAKLWRERRADDLPLIAFVWLLGELIASAASLQFYPHYFLMALAPSVLLAACAVRAIAVWLGLGPQDVRASALLLGILVLIPLERAQVDAAREISAAGDIPREIARSIAKAEGGRRPTLYVTNYKMSVLYSLTGAALPPTRYAVPSHLTSRLSAMVPTDPRVEVARVLARRPAYIVMDDSERLPDWAQAAFAQALTRYRPFLERGAIKVYRRT